MVILYQSYCCDDTRQPRMSQCLTTTSISCHGSVGCLGWLYFMLCIGETGIQVLGWFQLCSICLFIRRTCGRCSSHGDSQKGAFVHLLLTKTSHTARPNINGMLEMCSTHFCTLRGHGQERVENWIQQTASGHYSKNSIVLA